MADKKYLRDGRAPIPKNNITSKVMSANKAKDTNPELVLRKALWQLGIRGYRLHLKDLVGRPDISFPNKKVAIFVNGCFWHRCPHCDLPLPKSNTKFWENKFSKNKKRDIKKVEQLNDKGWITLIFWECQIIRNIEHCIDKVKETLYYTK
jgi:DNA mismatch endonuclease (patch repair protein)